MRLGRRKVEERREDFVGQDGDGVFGGNGHDLGKEGEWEGCAGRIRGVAMKSL